MPGLQDKLRSLAEADGLLVVKQVQEFFADFYAVNPDMFTLNLPGTTTLSRARCVPRLLRRVATLCWGALARSGASCHAAALRNVSGARMPTPVLLPPPPSPSLYSASYGPHETAALARSTQGLVALLLALKVKPYVRFQVRSRTD